MTRSVISIVLLLMFSNFSFADSNGDNWPQKPITLVVPYGAGGSTDIIARQFADFASRRLNQTVIVENRPGAGTNIGSSNVARAKPDGYTLLFGVDTLVTNPIIGPAPPFERDKSLQGISLISMLPGVIAANPQFQAADIQDLVKRAKQNPEKYTIASASLFLQIDLVNDYLETSLKHIPYKGGAQASADTVGGQVDLVFSNIPVVLELIKSKKLRAIAITSDQRSASLPQTPTLRESVNSQAVFYNWYALFAPKTTPYLVIKKMTAISHQFVNDEDISKKLESQGFIPKATTPEELETFMHQESIRIQNFARLHPELIVK